MEVKRVEHRCMNCSAYFSIDESVCKDAMTCPACKGPIKVVGYETVNVYVDGEPINDPLLTIELQNETAVPKVFYQGKEVTGKVHISFDWDTDTSIPGGLTYAIEHAVTGEGYPVINRIERRVKGHSV